MSILDLYLDHSATTPPRAEVIEAMQAAMADSWGNPSSLHAWGERAATAMEIARQQVADLLGSDPEHIVFTSGGTESNNLALLGIARRYARPQHLVISSVEHAAVENVARILEQEGWQVTRLPVDGTGRVQVADLAAALRPDTALVSVLHGQNEVGTLQPIRDLAVLCREARIPFHSDCVQTAGRLAVADLQIDLLSISGHKFYGPQGVGALYIRPGLPLLPLLRGGSQERQLRPGTQPLPAIVGMGVAAQLAQKEMAVETPRLRQLQGHLATLLTQVRGLIPTGPQDPAHRLPHHLSYCTEILSGTTIVQEMARLGIAISAGSACSSGKLVPSRIMLAMGYTPAQALGSIRLSLGRATTTAAVDQAAAALRRLLDP